MKLAELRAKVAASRPSDWEQLLIGPFYAERHAQISNAQGTWIEVDEHHTLAVWREDVRLRLAFGVELDRELDFGWGFPDPKVRRVLVDAFWEGALVFRWYVYDADGGRAYLPHTQALTPDSEVDWAKVEGMKMTAKPEDVAVARLVHQMSHGSADFDHYMRGAGIFVLEPPNSSGATSLKW